MGGANAWSYDILSVGETHFRRLSIFVSGVTLMGAAAEAEALIDMTNSGSGAFE
jgi:hypothetical protein